MGEPLMDVLLKFIFLVATIPVGLAIGAKWKRAALLKASPGGTKDAG